MIKQLRIIFVFFLVIVSFDFFEARFLSRNITLYFQFLYIAFAIGISLPFIFRKTVGFVLPVQLIFLSMLISIVMAYISWEQGLMQSLLATVPYMLWIFFFYLLETNFPIKTLEKIILIYGAIYCLLYFYQYTHAGTPLFGSEDEFKEDRGVIRIIFPGGGIFYLTSFMAINKLTTEKTKKWLWGLFSILGLVFTVLQVTRQSIFALLIIYFYHFIRGFTIVQRIILIGCFIGLAYLIGSSNNPVVKGLIDAQKTSNAEGKNNIRIIAATYFITDFSPNNITRIFGNGVPYALETPYALYVASLEDQDLYLADVGIIAFYTLFGILAIFAYILIWVKSFTLPISQKFYYVKYYLWYLLITSLTSNYVYDTQYLIATVFAIYIYQTVYLEERVGNILSRNSVS